MAHAAGVFGDVDLNRFLTDGNYGSNIFSSNGILIQMITGLGSWILGLIAILCAFMIIFGGYQYLFGALEGKGEGKQTVIYAVTGLVVSLLAYVIVATLLGVLGVSSTNLN